MNCDFVSMNSKTEYYDSAKILSRWGFTDSQCHNCGISNSDINGLLMQCAKCKRAYYCSMKCFNDHLPEHNKYCSTESIDCQPKGTGVEIEFKKKPIAYDEVEKSKGKAKKKKTPKHSAATDECELELNELMDSVADLPGQDIKEESVSSLMSQSFSEFGGRGKKSKKKVKKDKSKPKTVAPPELVPPGEDEEPELELSELMDSVSDLQPAYKAQPKEDSMAPLMSQSFSDFGRGKPRTVPASEPFAKEIVKLRHTEFTKHEYPWMTPDWINAQLRKTERGRELLEKGDLCGKITDVQSLIDQGYISWQKPDWTQTKLRHLSSRQVQTKEDGTDRAMSQSFSELCRDKPSSFDGQSSLRHAEFEKSGDFPWMTPEWIHAQLRKTERGLKLLETGEVLTDVQSLIEQGYITWEKPEWTQPKLRKTARGEAIVREAIAHETSFREEQAQRSFSNSLSHNSFSNE